MLAILQLTPAQKTLAGIVDNNPASLKGLGARLTGLITEVSQQFTQLPKESEPEFKAAAKLVMASFVDRAELVNLTDSLVAEEDKKALLALTKKTETQALNIHQILNPSCGRKFIRTVKKGVANISIKNAWNSAKSGVAKTAEALPALGATILSVAILYANCDGIAEHLYDEENPTNAVSYLGAAILMGAAIKVKNSCQALYQKGIGL
jgi:hypothetical protein